MYFNVGTSLHKVFTVYHLAIFRLQRAGHCVPFFLEPTRHWRKIKKSGAVAPMYENSVVEL